MLFDIYLLYLQLFVIHALCIWCLTYEVAVLLPFLIALLAYVRQPKPEVDR